MSDDAEAGAYNRIHAILDDARKLSGLELARYLDDSCGRDAELRASVLGMLAAGSDEQASDLFSDERAGSLHRELAGVQEEMLASWLPEKIGSYTILRQIGQGGMGVVYEAEQESPRRRVAIKLLHPMHATPESLRRFRREAQLLGHLQHPGIAQIIEASTYDLGRGPQPFFAMELVDGLPLTDHADVQALDVRARLALIAQLCDVLEYAHARGVIHRDLKPANILVTTRESSRRDPAVDARDASQARLKVLDFGIARATDSDLTAATLQTSEGQLVGTVSYMSPEQASGDPDAIDPRSDVYAVGVLAYELLAGDLPLRTQDKLLHEAVRVVREDEPSALGTRDRALRGDVETIVAKALEKERERRYGSAADMASDIWRYLSDQPIEARPPSTIYQLNKFARRHKALVGGVGATLLVAVVGAVVATSYALLARSNAREIERVGYAAGLAAAASAVDDSDFVAAARYLDDLPERLRGWEYDYLRARLSPQRDDWSVPSPISTQPVLDREGRHLVAAMADGTLGFWDTSSGELVETVALGSKTPLNRTTAVLHGPTRKVAFVTPDRDLVVRSFDGVELARFDPCSGDREAWVFAWDGSGQKLVYGVNDPYELRLWDGAESRILAEPRVTLAVFDRSRERFATSVHSRDEGGGSTQKVSLFDVETGELLARQALNDLPIALEFSPDDGLLAAAGAFRNVFLLDGRTLEPRAVLQGHLDSVYSATWTPDGERLITTSEDGTLRIWDRNRPGEAVVHALSTRVEGRTDTVLANASTGGHASRTVVTSDGRFVLVAGGRLQRFPLGDPSVLRGHESYVYNLAFSPDGSLLASAGFMDPGIHVWSVHRGEHLWTFEAPHSTSTQLTNGSNWEVAPVVAFSVDGRRLVAGSAYATGHWDVMTGGPLPVADAGDSKTRLLETLDAPGLVPLADSSLALSPDGERAVVTQDAALVYEVREPLGTLLEAPGMRYHAASLLASLKERHLAPNPIASLEGHVGTVYCVTFSPDGSRIATGGNDATIRIWDAETFEPLLVLRGHRQYVRDVIFSPDGSLLASASGDRTIRLWDTKPRHERRASSSAKR